MPRSCLPRASVCLVALILTAARAAGAEKETVWELTAPAEPASLAVDPSGRFAAFHHAVPGLSVIDSTTGKNLFGELGKGVYGAAFAADGKSVWVGGAKGAATRYSLPECKELERREVATVPLGQLAVSPNGKYLAWREHRGRRAGLADAATGKELAGWDEVECAGRGGNVLRPILAFSPDSSLVSFPSRAKALLRGAKNYAGNDLSELLVVWDIAQGKVRRVLNHYGPMRLGPGEWAGKHLYYAHRADTWDWRVHEYDPAADKIRDVGKLNGNSHSIDLFLSPDGKWIAGSYEQDVFETLARADGKVGAPYPNRAARQRFVGWERPDGGAGLVATIAVDGGLTAVGPADGKVVHTYKGFESRIVFEAVPLAGNRLAVLWHAIERDNTGLKYGKLNFSLVRVR